MNSYILELKDKEGNTKEVKLRLRSIDCIEIEKKTGKTVIDLAQEFSITNIVTILKYMRKWEIPQYSDADASELLDEIIDNGYVLEEILADVVYEGLAISGFFKKEDLQKVKKTMKKVKEEPQTKE